MGSFILRRFGVMILTAICLTFVVFFAILLGLYYALRSWRFQKTLLLVASYAFYAAWNPPFVILLWVSTMIDWFAAKRMDGEDDRRRRVALLCVSLGANLGLLGFFKYGGFMLENFQNVVGFYGMTFEAAKPDIILPVGISFYTFQTMSYTMDVYLGRSRSSKSFLDFALYVTFFPQLVAGPIVRATHFLPQCETPRRATRDMFLWGLFLMTLGLFQKIVLADVMLAGAADTVFGWSRGPVATLDAWLGVLAFSGQIFFDFAGYSTTAIGAAMCFGFSLPDNFRCPYAAIGFSDFWTECALTCQPTSTWAMLTPSIASTCAESRSCFGRPWRVSTRAWGRSRSSSAAFHAATVSTVSQVLPSAM